MCLLWTKDIRLLAVLNRDAKVQFAAANFDFAVDRGAEIRAKKKRR